MSKFDSKNVTASTDLSKLLITSMSIVVTDRLDRTVLWLIENKEESKERHGQSTKRTDMAAMSWLGRITVRAK